MKIQRLFLICLTCLPALSQAQSLPDYNQQRINTTRTSMLVLGGWGTANLVGGGILAATGDGESKYFHQMNAAWGSINLGIAALSYFSAKKIDLAGMDTFQTITEHYKTEKLFLLNAGVDLAYITAGLWMADRADRLGSNQTRWKGYGKSIAVQGAFLFVFDIANYLVHTKHGRSMKPMLEGLGFTGDGVYWVLKF